MTFKRMMAQLRLLMFVGNGRKRTEYAKRKGIFAEIGENCQIPIQLPLYPQLVRIHDNVIMHKSVILVTHDYINAELESMNLTKKYSFKNKEMLCPIEIMDNVEIAMNSIILGNVRIGPNAIICAGSVVDSDVPPNSVVAGNPAQVIGSFDKYVKVRIMMDKLSPFTFRRSGREAISNDRVAMAWERFDKQKAKKKQEE